MIFATAGIENSHLPNPSTWVAFGTAVDRFIEVHQLSRADRTAFLEAHNKTRSDIVGGRVRISVRPRYVYNGDEFINFATDIGLMSVRWSSVVAYFPAQEAHPNSG